jgi:hypothetical protein
VNAELVASFFTCEATDSANLHRTALPPAAKLRRTRRRLVTAAPVGHCGRERSRGGFVALTVTLALITW